MVTPLEWPVKTGLLTHTPPLSNHHWPFHRKLTVIFRTVWYIVTSSWRTSCWTRRVTSSWQTSGWAAPSPPTTPSSVLTRSAGRSSTWRRKLSKEEKTVTIWWEKSKVHCHRMEVGHGCKWVGNTGGVYDIFFQKFCVGSPWYKTFQVGTPFLCSIAFLLASFFPRVVCFIPPYPFTPLCAPMRLANHTLTY